MTSVVNGDVFDKSAIKNADGLHSDTSDESKSSLKNASLESDDVPVLKTDLPNASENDVNKTEKSCIDLTQEEDGDDVRLLLSNDKSGGSKDCPKENGSVNASPNSNDKEENSLEDSNAKVGNSKESKHLNNESGGKIDDKSIHTSSSKQTTLSDFFVKLDDNKKSTKQDSELSNKVSDDGDCVVIEDSKSDSNGTEQCPSVLDKAGKSAGNEKMKCDNEKGHKSDPLSEDVSLNDNSELQTNSQSASLDLSTAKGKESSDIQIINSDKSSLIEPNPLEKLNEHLNSIGGVEHPKYMHNVQKEAFISVAQKSDFQSSNKENKIMPQPQDRFKESPDNFVFAELSNEETGFPEVFSGLVKIGRYISVKGDFTLRSTEALVESPSLVSSYLLKEPDTFPPKEKDTKSESRDFFHSTAGEILIGIGLSRVNEWFHKDMVRIKKRQMKREGKKPHLEEELATHETNYAEAKKANNVYSYSYKVCKTCKFTTESSVVMEGHLLVPHITSRREYQCNFCDKIDRDPKAMLEHMEKIHKKIGRIQPPVLFFECPYCTFESNSKVKLNNHLAKCQRYFDHGVNQAPAKDFEFPALTPKPITVAVVKAYEKSLGSMQRGRGRPKKQDGLDSLHMNQYSPVVNQSPIPPANLTNYRTNSNSPLTDTLSIQNQIMSPMQMPNMNIRPAHSNSVNHVRPLHLQPPNRYYQVVNSTGQVVPLVGNNNPLATPPSQFPFSSNIINNGGKKMNTSGSQFLNSPLFSGGLRSQNSSKILPEVNITALPKLTGPFLSPVTKQTNQPSNLPMTSNSLVVCEICDGYIKDLDQLRTHMQLIHKVKIHPKMLVSRPPLNCQKCQWRFFTDQGLERHLLGAHGLVTSNMQELANKNKDAGCCTICGRVYASKLVSHMNQVHKVTLKPAHLSYKCTVCSATFNLYRLFENHVYLVHSGAAKRSSESGRSSPSKKHKSHSDKGDPSLEDEQRNHKEKKQSKDIEEEEVKICVECGDDVLSDKPDCKKCEKCLKSDELVQGTLSTKTLKDELRKKEKTAEKAA